MIEGHVYDMYHKATGTTTLIILIQINNVGMKFYTVPRTTKLPFIELSPDKFTFSERGHQDDLPELFL